MASAPDLTPSSGPARRPHLMSMTEIAELACVQRPVVSTWRRRHPDFPAPAGGNVTNPLFNSRQVADWLVATGRDREDRIESDLSLHALAGLRNGLAPRDLIAAVTALICLRAMDDEPLADPDGAWPGEGGQRDELIRRAGRMDPLDRCLLAEIALLPADPGWLAAAVDELIEASWGCRDAFERILAVGQRLRAGDLYARAIAPQLGRLTAELSGVRERAPLGTISVCDPAAGGGNLLTAVADLIGPDYQAVYQAAEADAYLARLAGRRLAVHGVAPADLKLVTGLELPEHWDVPDVIVSQIGYVPGEARSPEWVMDRLDDISLRLGPGCTAVVIGPADVLAGPLRPFSPAERTRAKVLSSGMTEAIVRLPGGLVPFRPGYELAAWVLTSAYNSPWQGWVLQADVSDRELTGEVIEALATDVITWRRDGYRPHAHTRAFGVQVRVGDLIGAAGSLSVRAPAPDYGGTKGPKLISHITELETGLDRLAAGSRTTRQRIRSQLAANGRTAPPAQTVGTLARAGRLTILPGTRLAEVPLGPDGHHDVIGVPELLGRGRRGDRRIDRVTLAGLPRARLTDPGDVIVTTTPQFRALADLPGLAVAEFPARVLRIPAAERQSFTPRTLAALLADRVPGLRPPGAVRSRRLAERELPLLSAAEVRFLDQLLATLDARREAAEQELDLLKQLQDDAMSGLGDGTLTFTRTPSDQTGL